MYSDVVANYSTQILNACTTKEGTRGQFFDTYNWSVLIGQTQCTNMYGPPGRIAMQI